MPSPPFSSATGVEYDLDATKSSPTASSITGSTSESHLLILLLESQREAESLRKELEVVQKKADAHEKLFEALLHPSNPAHIAATVVANVRILQERLIRAEVALEHAEAKSRFVVNNWLQVDKYFATIEKHARDSRAAFSRILTEDDGRLVLPHESNPAGTKTVSLNDYLRGNPLPPAQLPQSRHSLPLTTTPHVETSLVAQGGAQWQETGPERYSLDPRSPALTAVHGGMKLATGNNVDLRWQPPRSTVPTPNMPIRGNADRKLRREHIAPPPVSSGHPDRTRPGRETSRSPHEPGNVQEHSTDQPIHHIQYHAPPPVSKTRRRRSNAQQRAARLRADVLIRELEPKRVLCALCERWIKLHGKHDYIERPWIQHRTLCIPRHQNLQVMQNADPDNTNSSADRGIWKDARRGSYDDGDGPESEEDVVESLDKRRAQQRHQHQRYLPPEIPAARGMAPSEVVMDIDKDADGDADWEVYIEDEWKTPEPKEAEWKTPEPNEDEWSAPGPDPAWQGVYNGA